MKKSMLTIAFIAALSSLANAQTVKETRVNILDSDRQAYTVDFNVEEKVLADAWAKKSGELNIKSKNVKGFMTSTGVVVTDIHFESIDLYVKIEKLDKTRSSITITLSKGNTNFLTSEDGKIINNLQQFLEKFIVYTEQYKLSLDIKDMEDKIKDNQKAYDKLVADGKKLQEDIEKNKKDQEAKVNDLASQNKALEELKGKVK